MENVIKISEFIKTLKSEGLVIVSVKELDRLTGQKVLLNRKDLLKRQALTIREMLLLEVLPVKTKQGIRYWIEDGTIMESEVIRNHNGLIKIRTSFLKRKGYVN